MRHHVVGVGGNGRADWVVIENAWVDANRGLNASARIARDEKQRPEEFASGRQTTAAALAL